MRGRARTPNVSRTSEPGSSSATRLSMSRAPRRSSIPAPSAPDNPEMIAGRGARIPLVRRAEMLAELMRLRFSVAVGGTHGKTTTTSMIAAVLDAGGLDPTVVNGGIINAYGANAKVGEGEWIVVEADESDGTFLKLNSTVAVVTNIDPEHLDHHGDFAGLKKAFADFVRNIPFYGFAAVCVDDPDVQEMVAGIENRRLVTYGVNPQAEIRAIDVKMGPAGATFGVQLTEASGEQSRIDGMTIPMAGMHNVLNALAAFAVGPGTRHRRRPHQGRSGGVRRGAAALHHHRRRRRRADHRRLRPPSGGDRLGPRRRARDHRGPGDRRGPATPLHPPARPVRRLLCLLQRRRRGDRRRRLSGRRDPDRRLRPRRPRRRHTPSWPSSGGDPQRERRRPGGR